MLVVDNQSRYPEDAGQQASSVVKDRVTYFEIRGTQSFVVGVPCGYRNSGVSFPCRKSSASKPPLDHALSPGGSVHGAQLHPRFGY
jgi:hypothetical protein